MLSRPTRPRQARLTPSLLDRNGRPLRLGEKLGEGGEGAVFRLQDHPTTAVKVFTRPLAPDRVRKIDELVRLGSRDGVAPVAAWPSGIVFDRAGTAQGLLLPVVEGAKDIHHLYTPGSRRTSFPNADWRFLVHVAANVARAFATVHSLGLVIGDVNTGSVLVAADGTVRLIDVDSFQVPLPGGEVLLCHVAVPMFQPPELHGATLNRVVRTANHDAFGLAVTIFQLLMQGRHPYAGRYSGPGDMPIEKAIVEHRFAYGSSAATTGMSKPPNSVGLDVLPASVAGLFELAFSASAVRVARPPAADWVTLLEALSANLTACRINRTHHYSRHLFSCPWCSLESLSGALLFGVPQTASTRRAVDERDELARRLNALAPPRPLPTPAAAVVWPPPSDAATQAASIPAGAWAGYGVAAVLVLAGVLLLPAGLLLMVLGALGVALTQNAIRRRRKPFRSALRAAEEVHSKTADEFAAANAFSGYHAARARAQGAMAQLDGLPAVRAAQVSQLMANRHREQLGALLSSRLIENARISGIGAGRAATLAAYGITTAADVSPFAITQIPGFGQVMAERLTGWRYGLEKNFVFDPSKPVAPAAIALLDRKIADAQAQALRELRNELDRMEAAIRDEPTRAEAAAWRLHSAQQGLAQAQSDVAAATGRAAGTA